MRGAEQGWRLQPVTSCPACASRRASFLFSSPDRLHGVPGHFTYRRCEACASVFQSPRIAPEDLAGAYPEAYYTHDAPVDVPSAPGNAGRGFRDRLRAKIVVAVQGGTGDENPGWSGRLLSRWAWWRERAFRDLAFDEMIPRRRPAGRALDVGCGAGGLMVRLARLGWDMEGLEWDEAAAAVARTTGFPVHVGSAESLDSSLGPYRLVVLSHVFEHLADPAEALVNVARCLESGGRIVLVYPNCHSLGAYRFGPYWFGWEVPRHLVMTSGSGLRMLARRVGLKVVSVRTLPRSAEAHSRFSREYRRGSPVSVDDRRGSLGDRAFALAEAAAVALGAPVGEVVIASLMRDGSPPGGA